jgi:hypothetical protein
LLWADGTPKPSYEPTKNLFAAITAGAVDCSRFPVTAVGPKPAAVLAPVSTPAPSPVPAPVPATPLAAGA